MEPSRNNREKAMEWAVQIGHGSAEPAEATLQRAKDLFEAFAKWDEEIRKLKPSYVALPDAVRAI